MNNILLLPEGSIQCQKFRYSISVAKILLELLQSKIKLQRIKGNFVPYRRMIQKSVFPIMKFNLAYV